MKDDDRLSGNEHVSDLDIAEVPATIDKDFVERGSRTINDEHVEKVVNKADEIQDKFKSGGPLARFIEDAKLLLELVQDYWHKRYRRIPYWVIAAVVFTLLYVLTPIDLIPDPIPGIGHLDDAAVVAICLLLIEQELQEYKEWKMGGEVS